MQSFFQEVIRRKVLPVAVAYAIGGWMLLQVGDVLIGLLELPGWLGKARALSESMGLHGQTQWIDAQLERWPEAASDSLLY